MSSSYLLSKCRRDMRRNRSVLKMSTSGFRNSIPGQLPATVAIAYVMSVLFADEVAMALCYNNVSGNKREIKRENSRPGYNGSFTFPESIQHRFCSVLTLNACLLYTSRCV